MKKARARQDVLVQLTAVRSSVDRIIKLIAVDNLLDCVDESGRDHERVQDAINLIVKSR
ncbi:metal-sensing transcriptional repressor [Erysipelothrix sp. Poltava]|nr:metal-sensing transcriptional repressor [Erysipelothrix sp. Poltava]